jgi:hypothetical protein
LIYALETIEASRPIGAAVCTRSEVESKGFKRDVERFTCRIFWKGPSKSARIDEG